MESPTEGAAAPVRLLHAAAARAAAAAAGSDNLAIVRIVAVDAIRAAETVDDGREHDIPCSSC